jgi:uncharacterized protein
VITYVDTSSVLKLLIDEAGSERAGLIWDTADVVASAALVVVEGRAALAAAERGRRLTAAQHRRAEVELAALCDELTIVEITGELIATAADVAEEDALRGYDAVHLAAALTIDATVLTSADADLCRAAEGRGLHVANPLDP